jgi:nicotinate (nicotinamide) nucleotide adenylyltransferase
MIWYIIIIIIIIIVIINKVKSYIFGLKNKKVLLFGLSGNPPTGESGHRGIIRYIEKSKLYDEIWILPVYEHTYNSKKNLLSYETRIELCRLNFNDFRSCKVLRIEEDLFEYYKKISNKEEAIGTIKLLKYLNIKNKNIDFTFCLGCDTFNDLLLGKWFDNDEIIKTTNLLVINRKGYEIKEDILKRKSSKNIIILTIPYIDEVSSTKIKESLDGDNDYAKEKLFCLVYNYILEYDLYKKK